jgi:hypothetical protein
VNGSFAAGILGGYTFLYGRSLTIRQRIDHDEDVAVDKAVAVELKELRRAKKTYE